MVAKSYTNQRSYGMGMYFCFHIIKTINYFTNYLIIHVNTSDIFFIIHDLGKMYHKFYRLMSLSDHVILIHHADGFLLYYMSSAHKNGSWLAHGAYWKMKTGDSHIPSSCYEDDTYITGRCYYAYLPIDGQALIVVGIQNKVTRCECAFGWVPPPKMFKRNALCIRWLWENFSKLLGDYDDEILWWHVNAC